MKFPLLEDLSELSEILGPMSEKLPVPAHPKEDETLKLNTTNVLIGEYPKLLDLRKYNYALPNTVINDKDEFKLAENESRPPQASIYISGKSSVEVIYFPSDNIGEEYAVIENLPNLKELHICRTENGLLRHDELKWLICKNLPNLKTITAEGGIFWLQLEDLPSLESIDVSKCINLDYFSIQNAPALKKVKISNCKKLRKIVHLPYEIQSELGITKQIQKVQKNSKLNGKLYKNMTFTDIDNVLAIINNGAKVATRKGLFPVNVYPKGNKGFCDGRENDPEFVSFGFDLLRPLESVIRGHGIDTYAYVAINLENGCSNGQLDQEDCLEDALGWVDHAELIVPEVSNPSEQQILDYLNQLLNAEK